MTLKNSNGTQEITVGFGWSERIAAVSLALAMFIWQGGWNERIVKGEQVDVYQQKQIDQNQADIRAIREDIKNGFMSIRTAITQAAKEGKQ